MAPYRIDCTHDGVAQKPIQGKMVSDPEITPFLISAAFQEALLEQPTLSREFTLAMTGEITMEGLPALQVAGEFSGAQDALTEALSRQLQIVTVVLQQDWQVPQVTGLHLTLKVSERQESWSVERVELSQTHLEAGQTVQAIVTVQALHGDRRQIKVQLPLPPGLRSGRALFRAAAGQDLDNRALFRELQAIQNPTELIDRLNRRRINRRLYLQLVTADQGLAIAQYELPALPPSVRSVMAASNQSDRNVSLPERVWTEVAQPFDGVLERQR